MSIILISPGLSKVTPEWLVSDTLIGEHVSLVPAAEVLINEPMQENGSDTRNTIGWSEAASLPILSVRCGDTNGELQKSKLGSGNKGKCIKVGDEWFTPTEFEIFSGRGSSKDWKRSIRFGGTALQKLIDTGHLLLHSGSCICSACLNEENRAVLAPVKPFIRHARTRKVKEVNMSAVKKARMETPNSPDIAAITNNIRSMAQMNLPEFVSEGWQVLQNTFKEFASVATILGQFVEELRDRTTKENEKLNSELATAGVEKHPANQMNNGQVPIPNGDRMETQVTLEPVQYSTINMTTEQHGIINICNGEVYITQLEDEGGPSTLVSLESNNYKCDNCARPGTCECSGCYQVHYCSEFCQKKDWIAHRARCCVAQIGTIFKLGGPVK